MVLTKNLHLKKETDNLSDKESPAAYITLDSRLPLLESRRYDVHMQSSE